MNHNYTFYYFIEKFNSKEIINLNKKINIIFRNYVDDLDTIDLKGLVNLCHKKQQKIFLANDLKRAFYYKFDGVYIPSFNKLKNFNNLKLKKNFKIIGSAHKINEIIIKKKQGCSEIFTSPIFETYKKNYLGVVRFNLLNLNNRSKIYALGGINENNIKKLRLTKSVGFGSISWIKKTGPQ